MEAWGELRKEEKSTVESAVGKDGGGRVFEPWTVEGREEEKSETFFEAVEGGE